MSLLRPLSARQRELLRSDTTCPIYLIDLDLTGEQHLSTAGEHMLGGVQYVPEGVEVQGLTWARATLRLPANPERHAALTSAAGAWRGRSCVIRRLPAVEYPRLYQEGTWAPDLADEGLVTAEPVIALDGVLAGAEAAADWIDLTVVHPVENGMMSPRLRTGAPWAYHMPVPGTLIAWDGETITLEA